MKRASVCFFAVLLVGCHQQKPRFSDEQIQAIRTADPGMTDACIEKLRWGGIQAMPKESDQCYKFEKPKMWKGLWINQFEGSIFCPTGSPCPDERSGYGQEIWLEFSSPYSVQEKLVPGGAYEVDFIGRRSIGAGHFGHFGMSGNDIIVDRMISMKEVRSPPKN